MIRGDFGHGKLEVYHNLGTPIDLIVLPELRKGMPFVYPYGTPGVHSEGKVNFQLGNVEATGKIDISNVGDFYLTPLELRTSTDGVPEVLDYKFNKSPKYWKSPTELKSDIQMNVYAQALWPDKDVIRLSHVAFQTTTPHDSAKATVITTQDKIQTINTTIVYPEVEAIKETRATKNVEDTRVKLSGCSAYGGCSFKDTCSRVSTTQKGTVMSLLKDMLSKKVPGGATPPAKPPAGTVAVQRVMEAAKAAPAKGRSRTEIVAPKPKAPPKVPEGYQMLEDGSIVPIQTEMPTEDEDGSVSIQTDDSPSDDIGPVTVNGRVVREGPAIPLQRATAGLRLFVDVTPKRIPSLEDLDMYLMGKCQEIAAHFNIEDIRIAVGDSPLAFGRWKGFLIAAIRNEPPPPGDYLITGGTMEVKQCLIEALEPFSDLTVVP